MEFRFLSSNDLTEQEFRDFRRLVIEGGQVSRHGLDGRIRRAPLLAAVFDGGEIIAVGAVKLPDAAYRARTFDAAGVAGADHYVHELGWVHVPVAHKGKGIGQQIVRGLLSQMNIPLYATSRSDRGDMHHIMGKSGFARAGKSWASSEEDAVQVYLFLR